MSNNVLLLRKFKNISYALVSFFIALSYFQCFSNFEMMFFVKNINIFRIYIVVKIQKETYFPDKICSINDEL